MFEGMLIHRSHHDRNYKHNQDIRLPIHRGISNNRHLIQNRSKHRYQVHLHKFPVYCKDRGFDGLIFIILLRGISLCHILLTTDKLCSMKLIWKSFSQQKSGKTNNNV